MDSFKKFFDGKLPDRCEFFNSFRNECISGKDYLHFFYFIVLIMFKMNTMNDYHILYLKTDVLLLSDVFEKLFMNMCLKYYELDPCHYVGSPGLSWDAMLKISEIELKIISITDMYLFVEKRMRGSISYIAKKFNKVNNKYIKSCDNSKQSKYITYLNVNNWYGWLMSQYLPYSKFKWLNQKEVDKFDVNLIGENSLDRCILEVELEYPDELHELHNDYPLAPGKLEINHDMLLKYCSNIASKYDKNWWC